MHVKLDYIAVEGGQVFCGDVVLMANEVKLRVLEVEPLGHVPTGDEVNLAHPGGELFHAAEPVFKQLPIAVAFIPRIDVLIGAKASLLLSPGGVAAVHPGYNKI